jgi:hypothetical protein
VFAAVLRVIYFHETSGREDQEITFSFDEEGSFGLGFFVRGSPTRRFFVRVEFLLSLFFYLCLSFLKGTPHTREDVGTPWPEGAFGCCIHNFLLRTRANAAIVVLY